MSTTYGVGMTEPATRAPSAPTEVGRQARVPVPKLACIRPNWKRARSADYRQAP